MACLPILSQGISSEADTIQLPVIVSNPSILPKECKPANMTYEDIEIASTTNPSSAYHRKTNFIVELRSDPMPSTKGLDKLLTPNIICLWAFPRTRYGFYLKDHLDQCPHYEVSQDSYGEYKAMAQRKGLEGVDHFVPGRNYSESIDKHHIFLSLQEEDTLEDIHNLDLIGVFNDIIIKDHPKSSTKLLVAEMNSRGNRGPSLGYAGAQSSEPRKNAPDGNARPNIITGTKRYAPLATKMSSLVLKMWEKSKFGGASFVDKELFPKRQEEFARDIDDGNIFESISILFLIHKGEKLIAGADTLLYHTDKHNCSEWPFLGCAWEEFFCRRLNSWVTGMVTCCFKDSIAYFYKRQEHIGEAARYILKIYQDSPPSNQVVMPRTFPSDVQPPRNRPFGLIDIHYDPVVHQTPVI